MNIVDPTTGEYSTAQVFVAVMGASNDTFAKATFSQNARIEKRVLHDALNFWLAYLN
jgi:transposase